MSDHLFPVPRPPKPEPRRDEFWDAIVKAWGEPATKSERGLINSVVRELKDADLDPAGIAPRAAIALTLYPNCTPRVLATRWSDLGRLASGLGVPGRLAPEYVQRSMRELGWANVADEAGFLRWLAAGRPPVAEAAS